MFKFFNKIGEIMYSPKIEPDIVQKLYYINKSKKIDDQNGFS
jgi:hypothetical protein